MNSQLISEGHTAQRPLLLIISGDPGSGKSTLADRCSTEFGLPVLSRDVIKESLFDTLGWSDRAWSRKVGSAGYEVLFAALETILHSDGSCILDCHVSSPHARARIASLLATSDHGVFEVICVAPREVLVERFEARAKSGLRHPGHADIENLDELRERLGAHPEVLLLPDCTYSTIDTHRTELEDAVEDVRALLSDSLGANSRKGTAS